MGSQPFDYSTLYGSMPKPISDEQRAEWAPPTSFSASGLASGVKENLGLLGLIAGLSMLSRRGNGGNWAQTLGGAGIDALGALGNMGARKMSYDKQAREEARQAALDKYGAEKDVWNQKFNLGKAQNDQYNAEQANAIQRYNAQSQRMSAQAALGELSRKREDAALKMARYQQMMGMLGGAGGGFSQADWGGMRGNRDLLAPQTPDKLPFGVRTNNLGNIGNDEAGNATVYPTTLHGLSAMNSLLFGDKSKYSKGTVAQAARMYTPSSDVLPEWLKGTGIDPNAIMSSLTREQRLALMNNIVTKEGHKKYLNPDELKMVVYNSVPDGYKSYSYYNGPIQGQQGQQPQAQGQQPQAQGQQTPDAQGQPDEPTFNGKTQGQIEAEMNNVEKAMPFATDSDTATMLNHKYAALKAQRDAIIVAKKTRNDDEKETYSKEKELRKDFETSSAAYFNSGKVLTDLLSSAKGNSGIGDLSMIYAMMKMFDPSSVVQEGEVTTVKSLSGIPEQLKNIYFSARDGNKLTSKQKHQMMSLAREFFVNRSQEQRFTEQRFRELAPKYNTAPERIVYDPFTGVLGQVDDYLKSGLEWGVPVYDFGKDGKWTPANGDSNGRRK